MKEKYWKSLKTILLLLKRPNSIISKTSEFIAIVIVIMYKSYYLQQNENNKNQLNLCYMYCL